MKNKIGIAISTFNRPEVFLKTKESILSFMPPNSNLIVIEDASEMPYSNGDFVFNERAGIPRVKNKSIEMLLNHGCEHFFLFDDDVQPICDNWWIPYIKSGFKHLSYTFLPWYKQVDGHKFHKLSNGIMMYIHKDVIDKIGGFDTTYGMGKFEHTSFSYRAYAAGFIPEPFIDVIGSNKLFHSMDENNEIDRTFTSEEQALLLNNNREYYYKTRMLTDFIPFK